MEASQPARHSHTAPLRALAASLVLMAGLCTPDGGALAGEGRGWHARYSGDLNGEVGGRIVVPGGTSMVSMLKGASMSPDMKSKGNAALSMKVMTLPGQEPMLREFDLTLADGTSCRLQPDGNQQVEMHDTSKDNYSVSLKGLLSCDGGKLIKAEATARR